MATASDVICDAVYAELKRLAAWRLASVPGVITLDATDLAHEAMVRLLKQRRIGWAERTQTLAVASLMIRRVLSNHLRWRSAAKRGGGRRTSAFAEATEPSAKSGLDLMALHHALESLERLDERQARIVELKFFGGLSTGEIASVLNISTRTVQLSWNHARLWLARELNDER